MAPILRHNAKWSEVLIEGGGGGGERGYSTKFYGEPPP